MQRAVLVGTLKVPMQRLVNVLNDMVVKQEIGFAPDSRSKVKYASGYWRRRNGKLEYVETLYKK